MSLDPDFVYILDSRIVEATLRRGLTAIEALNHITPIEKWRFKAKSGCVVYRVNIFYIVIIYDLLFKLKNLNKRSLGKKYVKQAPFITASLLSNSIEIKHPLVINILGFDYDPTTTQKIRPAEGPS